MLYLVGALESEALRTRVLLTRRGLLEELASTSQTLSHL